MNLQNPKRRLIETFIYVIIAIILTVDSISEVQKYNRGKAILNSVIMAADYAANV